MILLLLGCDPIAPVDTTPTPSPSTTPTPTTPPAPTSPADGLFSDVTSALSETIGSIVVVSWDQHEAATVHVEFSFDDGVWQSSPVRELEAGAHEELLLGVPFDETVTWRLVGQTASGTISTADATAETGRRPPTVPPATLHSFDPKVADPALQYLLVGVESSPYWTIIVDRQGRVVWASPSPPQTIVMYPRVAKDGHSLYIDRNTFWAIFDSSLASVVQMAIDGTILREIDTPSAHHPFTDLPDGSIAYGAASGYANEFVQVVHPDGSTDTLWDCEAWLAEIGASPFEYCNSNTLFHDPVTNKFLMSFWSSEAVVEIDGTSGEVARYFGHLPGAYTFDPPDSAFWWQHGGNYTPSGTFLTSTHLTEAGGETVAREYEVDDATRTLRQVWSFGIGDGLFSQFEGEAHRLSNGNTLHNLGSLPRVREAAPDGTVVWDVQWDNDGIGRTTPIADLYDLALPRP